jgi:hypothetical protein
VWEISRNPGGELCEMPQLVTEKFPDTAAELRYAASVNRLCINFINDLNRFVDMSD